MLTDFILKTPTASNTAFKLKRNLLDKFRQNMYIKEMNEHSLIFFRMD